MRLRGHTITPCRLASMPPPGQMAPLLWHRGGPTGLLSSANKKDAGKRGQGGCTVELCIVAKWSDHLNYNTL